MIDLNKKYTTKNGYEVVLYDIVDNWVHGRHLDPKLISWVPTKWHVNNGLNRDQSRATNDNDLVEIVKFKLTSLNCKDVWYHGYYISIPRWVKWIATNSYGDVWVYENKPELDSYGQGWIKAGRLFRVMQNVQFVGDWRDSLNEVF